MNIDKQFFINLYKKIINDKIVFSLVVLGVFSIAASISLLVSSSRPENTPGRGNTEKTNSNNGNDAGSENSEDNGFDIFGLLKDSEKESDTGRSNEEALINIPDGNPSAQIPSTISLVNPDGSKTEQGLSNGGVTNTVQGTINTNSSIQQGVDSNEDTDDIAMNFGDPDGGTSTYIPPGTPDAEIKWGRYTNDVYNYSLNYPVNWQQEYSVDSQGYESLTLYPPGVDTSNPNSPFIAFAFSTYFDISGTHLKEALTTEITVDGQDGNLYTDGAIGSSYITSFIDYLDGSFGLTATISDETFAYIYYYMINSLDFNTE